MMEFTVFSPEQSGQQPEEAVYYDEEFVTAEDTGGQTAAPAPQVPEERPCGKKPWNKRLILAAAAAVLVLALHVVGIAAVAGNSPVKLVMDSIGNTLESVGDDELLILAQKALHGGSFAFEMPVNDLEESLIYGYGNPFVVTQDAAGTLGAKLYTDVDRQQLALTAQGPFAGQQLDASLYVNLDACALSMPALLEETYGVNLKTLADTLPQSVFAPESGSGFAMDEETFEQLLQQLGQIDGEAKKQNEALAKQTEKTVKKLVKKLAGILEEYAVEKGSDTLAFVSSEVKVTCVQLVMDGAAVSQTGKSMFRWIDEDKDVKKLVTMVCEQNAAQFGALTGDTAVEPEELVTRFYDWVGDMIDASDDLADDWEDTVLSLDFYITKSGKRLVKLDARLDEDADQMRLTLTAGPSLGEPELICVQYQDAWQDYELSYGVEESTSKQYSARLREKQNSVTTASASVSWDKKEGDLRIKFENEDGTVLVKGSLLADKKSAALYIRSVTLDEDILKPELTVTILADDKVPEMPAYTEILLLSEQELNALGTQVQQNLLALLGLA